MREKERGGKKGSGLMTGEGGKRKEGVHDPSFPLAPRNGRSRGKKRREKVGEKKGCFPPPKAVWRGGEKKKTDAASASPRELMGKA